MKSASKTVPTLRVLLVEDVAADAELEVREIKRAGLRVSHRIVDSEKDFIRALREVAPDVILSDFSMPQFDGMEALRLAKELAPDIPFIFVSGTLGEEYAIRALKNGATDYVVKSNLVRLSAAVERALAEAKVQRERRQTEAELEIARERLQEREAGLRRAQLVAKLAHVITGPDGSFESWSDTLPSLIGMQLASMPRSTREWLDIVHPEDREALRAKSIEAGTAGHHRAKASRGENQASQPRLRRAQRNQYVDRPGKRPRRAVSRSLPHRGRSGAVPHGLDRRRRSGGRTGKAGRFGRRGARFLRLRSPCGDREQAGWARPRRARDPRQ